MSNTKTQAQSQVKLAGRQFRTEDPAWHESGYQAGDVLFCIEREYFTDAYRPALPESIYYLSTTAGIGNLNGEIQPLGSWLGTTDGTSKTQIGRVQLIRRTADGGGWMVRLVDETAAEFMSAAVEAAAAAE